MSTARRIQARAYRIQRVAGDVAAMQRSPGAYVKRRVRRRVTRSLFALWR